MRHKIFIAFLSLLTATSTLDMAKAQSLPYKNKNLPIEERVEDLLNRMTVDEKIAQIRHIHSSKIFNGQELDMKKLTDWVILHGDLSKAFPSPATIALKACISFKNTW